MELKHSCLFAQADAARLPLASDSVDLVCGSPPYCRARSYLEDGKDLGIARDCLDWVEWMLAVTREAIRVTRGLVIWVCAGPTEDRQYQPGPEGLVWEWYKCGGFLECPVYWHRVGISGSGGDQWFRKDVEYCLAFKKTLVLPHADNTACGHPPKWAPGGEMSHRLSDGTRRNQWGSKTSGNAERNASGTLTKRERPSHQTITKGERFTRTIKAPGESGKGGEVQSYKFPVLANPGNLLEAKVGGGHLGSPWAHESEAPYPTKVPEFFIKSFTKPGDLVVDVFSGSGSTCEAAEALGRRSIGFDLRMSQCRIGLQRITRPHLDVLPSKKVVKQTPLFKDLED